MDEANGPLEPSAEEAAPPRFEDLTLDLLLAQMLRAPVQTWRQLRQASKAASGPRRQAGPALVAPPARLALPAPKLSLRSLWDGQYGPLWLQALALLSALYGSAIARGTAEISRHNDMSLHLGAPWLLLGFLLWLLAEFRSRQLSAAAEPQQHAAILRRPPPRPTIASIWAEISHPRKLLIALAALNTVTIWQNTSGNRIAPPIILLWLVNIALWALVFAPLRWSFFAWASDRIDGWRRFRLGPHLGVMLAFALLLAAGHSFRFERLDTIPAQMYSDHVENIQDAYRIHHQGDDPILLSNYNGRESLHVYLLAILGSQPGANFDHYIQKWLGAVEGLLLMPLMFYLGRELAGPRQRRWGYVLGLLAMGLVGASFWHVALNRQGLRPSLSLIFMALMAIFFIRALRDNRRADYVKTGLALGFALLSYPSARLLPAVLVIALAIALLLRKFSWRQRGAYLLNLVVLAFVALVVFLPLFHVWVEQPDAYLYRSASRIYGDNLDAVEDKVQFLLDNSAVLLSNLRNALLMFHYTHENSWTNVVSGEPALDTVSAAFFMLGAAAWLARLLRGRDPAYWYLPLLILAALLSAALAITFPKEVPHFVRSSGAIPPVYLIAALPLALFCRQLCLALPKGLGTVAALLVAAAALLAAQDYNRQLYFDRFHSDYAQHSHAHAEAGAILRGFVNSDGAYGNAFVIGQPHWWDHRAVGIEGGALFWPNTASLAELPGLLRGSMQRSGPFRLLPERDLLFFYAPQDEAALPQLEQWFPAGKALLIESEPPSNRSFYIYRVPALGEAGLQDFLRAEL